MDIVELNDEVQQSMKNIIKAVQKHKDSKNISELLTELLKNIEPRFELAELEEDNLREQLWASLHDIAQNTKDATILSKVFHAIRILGREKKCLRELVTDKWISIFETNIKPDSDSDEIKVIELEKALCNLIFNNKDIAIKAGNGEILKIILNRIENARALTDINDVLFFDVKLLFLITAIVREKRNELSDYNIILNLVNILELILEQAIGDAEPDLPSNFTDKQVNLACETLKALFNVTINVGENPKDIEQCNKIVLVLKNYLLSSAVSFESIWKLKNDVVNLLTNMPNECYINLLIPLNENKIMPPKKFVFEQYNMLCIYELLMLLQAKFNEQSTVTNQHELFSPVLTVLHKGAVGHRPIRKYLRLHILPPLTDVHHRPEEGSTIRNHLCKLLTTPITKLRNIVAELLFVLCKKNVARMIKYTGYGNAAGLLAQKGLLGGQRDVSGEKEFSSDSEDSETEEYAEHKHGINPVLGCYEEKKPNPMANMTKEQKEYEAMKLVKLIDDLTKVGTIKPCTIGKDGKPKPIEHVMQLQEHIKAQKERDSDSN